jgi:hypothetical protein
MKLALPTPPEVKFPDTDAVRKIFINLLKFYSRIYLAETDVEVSYNNVYKSYDVSVFRWSKCSAGCGTKDQRDKAWVDTQTAIEELFHIEGQSVSWRWVQHHRLYDGQRIETDNGKVPGVRYFIKAGSYFKDK